MGREFHTFNCFCFVYVPKKPFWKYNHCSAGPQIMTWHDLTFMSESILAMSKSTNWPMSKYCQVINNVQHIKGTERRFKIGLSPIPEIAEENLSMKSFYLRCSDLSHQLILKQGTTTADDQIKISSKYFKRLDWRTGLWLFLFLFPQTNNVEALWGTKHWDGGQFCRFKNGIRSCLFKIWYCSKLLNILKTHHCTMD